MNLTPRSWKILNKERDGRLAKLKAEGPSSGLRSIFFQTPEEIVREAIRPAVAALDRGPQGRERQTCVDRGARPSHLTTPQPHRETFSKGLCGERIEGAMALISDRTGSREKPSGRVAVIGTALALPRKVS
jgi:hypothetical protein